jgi:hypothetical protein
MEGDEPHRARTRAECMGMRVGVDTRIKPRGRERGGMCIRCERGEGGGLNSTYLDDADVGHMVMLEMRKNRVKVHVY